MCLRGTPILYVVDLSFGAFLKRIMNPYVLKTWCGSTKFVEDDEHDVLV